jgi:alpha/beta hydrolase fold
MNPILSACSSSSSSTVRPQQPTGGIGTISTPASSWIIANIDTSNTNCSVYNRDTRRKEPSSKRIVVQRQHWKRARINIVAVTGKFCSTRHLRCQYHHHQPSGVSPSTKTRTTTLIIILEIATLIISIIMLLRHVPTVQGYASPRLVSSCVRYTTATINPNGIVVGLIHSTAWTQQRRHCHNMNRIHKNSERRITTMMMMIRPFRSRAMESSLSPRIVGPQPQLPQPQYISTSRTTTMMMSPTSASSIIPQSLFTTATTTESTSTPVLLQHMEFGSIPTVSSTSAPTPAAPPVVVFLHGLLGNKRNFASIGRSLAQQQQQQERRFVSLDLRNHGDNVQDWRKDMSYTAMARDVIHFCQMYNFTQIEMIGHSVGGKVAQLRDVRVG